MTLRKNKKSGFSLIELSIVLIIIGLLIAGVTGGASLIKSSELRAIITESRTWAVSVNSFYNQFDSLPGDYDQKLGDITGGDDDGTIEYDNNVAGAGDEKMEGRNAWRHLSITKILDSSVIYATAADNTDLPAAAKVTAAYSTFGIYLPASKIQSAGWDFDYDATSTDNVVVLTGTIAKDGTNTDTLVNNTIRSTGAITPIDALSLDSKYDDGNGAAGSVQGVGTTNDCHNGGAYATTKTAKGCALSFKIDVNS